MAGTAKRRKRDARRRMGPLRGCGAGGQDSSNAIRGRESNWTRSGESSYSPDGCEDNQSGWVAFKWSRDPVDSRITSMPPSYGANNQLKSDATIITLTISHVATFRMSGSN